MLQNAKDKHLPKKRVRYDKKKHKSSKWMTNDILKSINTKDRMYKKLLRAKISKAREELPNKYLLNYRTLTNMDKIANEFNKYFINIGRLLSEQITSGHSSDEYLNDKTKLVFNFTPVTKDYIANVISNLKNKSSYGYDNISNKLIKLAKGLLTQPLTLISNQILRTGIFPKELKIS